MATVKTNRLTFRIGSGLNEALHTVIERKHRSIVKTVEVLIGDCCARNEVEIPTQSGSVSTPKK